MYLDIFKFYKSINLQTIRQISLENSAFPPELIEATLFHTELHCTVYDKFDNRLCTTANKFCITVFFRILSRFFTIGYELRFRPVTLILYNSFLLIICFLFCRSLQIA